MTRYGMLIDTRRCVGCYACRVACQTRHALEPHEAYIKFHNRERGTFPHVAAETVPTQCMHCEDAPCQRVCPTGATYTTDEGIVLVNQERCIGCKYCVETCPYDARVVAESGVAEKCRFCADADGRQTTLPACVSTCLTGARIFGDLDDPDSEISKAIVERNAKPIAGDLTAAKIYYVR